MWPCQSVRVHTGEVSVLLSGALATLAPEGAHGQWREPNITVGSNHLGRSVPIAWSLLIVSIGVALGAELKDLTEKVPDRQHVNLAAGIQMQMARESGD